MKKLVKLGFAAAVSAVLLMAAGCAEQPAKKDCCQAGSCKDMTQCKGMAGFKGVSDKGAAKTDSDSE